MAIKPNGTRWTILVIANVLIWGVLGFYRTSGAGPKEGGATFANAIVQRNDIIAQLKELNAQLKQQNALLQSGKMTVIVSKDQ